MLINNLKQRGSTMIELLIALMVVGVVVTAIAVAGTHSVKNSSEARYKQIATNLAQEVVEKTRSENNRLGLSRFSQIVGSNTYCFDDIPDDYTTALPSQGICGTSETVVLAGINFTRQVTFTTTQDMVDMEIVVSWQDGSSTREVTQKQQLLKPNFNH